MFILKSKYNGLIDFRHSHRDYGHLIVRRIRPDKSQEVIGHVYTEIEDSEIKYFSTNRRGREIFPPTTDFNEVEGKFERYANLRALEEAIKYYNKPDNLSFKNPNTMQTNQQNPESKQKKVNQIIFVEYEKPLNDGHFITVVDSYRNVLGRINKVYSEELNKYEYFAYDHEGKPIGEKSEKVWQLKNDFTNNREALLEQAHQRRIASKEKEPEQKQEKPTQPVKTEERKKETEKVRQTKNNPEKQQSKSKANGKDKTVRNTREEELEEIRDEREEDFGDMER